MNKAIRQRKNESSANIKKMHLTMKMTFLQQSQMIMRRKKRAQIMNLTEKKI
jgi:hypothetical protein